VECSFFYSTNKFADK